MSVISFNLLAQEDLFIMAILFRLLVATGNVLCHVLLTFDMIDHVTDLKLGTWK